MNLREWIPKKRDFKQFSLHPYQFRIGLLKILLLFSLLVIVSLVISGVLKILGISIKIPDSISLPQLIELFGPLILTLALVYLYYQQQHILATQQSSSISVNRFIDGDDDVIDLLISNSGHGACHAVFLQVELEFEGERLQGGTKHLGLYTEEEDGTRRSFVKPFENSQNFKKKLLMPLQFPNEDDERGVPFHMMMSFADNFDIDQGHLTLTLLWEDNVSTGEVELFDEYFDIEQDRYFDAFISRYPAYHRGFAGQN